MVYSLNLHIPKCRQPRSVLAALYYVQVLYIWFMNKLYTILCFLRSQVCCKHAESLCVEVFSEQGCGDVSADILINIEIHDLVIFKATHETLAVHLKKLLSHVRQK